jgi:hypothetical protein
MTTSRSLLLDPIPKCTRASPWSGVSSTGPFGRTRSEGQWRPS